MFRGDAAFAKPELYEYLEESPLRRATPSGFPPIRWFRSSIQPLLEPPTEWPSPGAYGLLSRFCLPGFQSWRLPHEWWLKHRVASWGVDPQGRFHRDQPELSTQRDSPLLQWPWHGGAMDKRRQIRLELDPAFLPQVRGEPGEARSLFVLAYNVWATFCEGWPVPESMKHWSRTSLQTRLIIDW